MRFRLQILMWGWLLVIGSQGLTPLASASEATQPIGETLTVSEDSPLHQQINRRNAAEVMTLLEKSYWLDGNLSLRFETGALSDRQFDTVIKQQMGLSYAITTISDCLRSVTAQTCDVNATERYGLKPYPEFNNQNYVSFYRNYFHGLPDVRVLHSSLQIDPSRHAKQLGVFISAQKHFPIAGNPRTILTHQASGLSVFQMVYGGNSEAFNATADERLAYGVYETVPDIDGDGTVDGLTALGRRVIDMAVDNGILLDVSHAADESIKEAVVQVNRRAPVMMNHMVAEQIPVPQGGSLSRGAKDASIVAVASTGGVMHVIPLREFLIGDQDCDAVSLTDEFVRHVNYLVDVINHSNSGLNGAEHVGLASDSFVDGWSSSANWSACELDSQQRWHIVMEVLARQQMADGRYRYSIRDLQNIAGRNAIRVLKNSLPGYSQPAQPNVQKIQSSKANGASQHRFSWPAVKVISTQALPELAFKSSDVKYHIVVYGYKKSGRSKYVKLHQASTASTSTLAPSKLFDSDKYSHYRLYIKVFNKRFPRQYTNSEWFYF